jgi:hypothetical protein
MDHDLLGEQLLARDQCVMEHIWQAPDRHSVAAASLALCAQVRHGARDLRQAKITLEAQPRQRADITPCCPEAGVTSVHPRPVSPETWFGESTMPVRTVQCRGCRARFRPDDGPLGGPESGTCTDDGRDLSAPVAAEWPPRVAKARCARCTAVCLSACGGQGLSESTADALHTWPAERETCEAEAVGEAVAWGDGGAALRVESAMAGGRAHLDGRWQDAQGGPSLGRQLEAQAAEPPLGAVLARRAGGVLGSAEDLAGRLTQVMREAGWERLPLGPMRGDGAPWIWMGAAAHVPGVRQTLDDDHLSAHLSAFAQSQAPHHPAGAKAWVDQTMGARLTDRIGEVLGALKRTPPWTKAVRTARAQLIGDVERHRTRIRDQEPWPQGLAVGSGAVAGACKPVMQSRFKRAGRRWAQPGFLNVLALRLAHLNGTLQAFWASRGLTVQVSG